MVAAAPEPTRFVLPVAIAPAVAGRRVFVTGAGKHHGLGQGFAYAAGLSGAASVAVHFNQSYEDALATVDAINAAGGNAFGVQADVTNPRTEAYADNAKVYGRWQPRMLAPEEASTALFQLLLRPRAELNDHFFQLEVEPADGQRVRLRWADVRLEPRVEPLAWSAIDPLVFD